ncbi:phosphatase PAP2 family protein [Streptomyces chattanoogensis]|uniref:phosphatase PAP2 family protein n=1 Tax=Streptomyces chattanoogensis TaxID=66876 RepID=UPI00099C1D18|nr:phosphatase PAP2 family protein [Streptomyces chattanoogensis]
MSAPDAVGPVRGPRPACRSWPGPLRMAAVCAALFAALVTTALTGGGKGALPGDRALHDWTLVHRPDAAVATARALTDSGTGIWPYLLVAFAGFLTGRGARGRTAGAVAALAVLLLGQGLRLALMLVIARPRPPHADWATHASRFSMPSGHSTTSALVAGLVCWAAAHAARRILRWCVWGPTVLWAAGVGLTRIYLGVRWPSDVVTGWLLAAAYLATMVALTRGRLPVPRPPRTPRGTG